MDMTVNGSKMRCYKEQYSIGTWSVSPLSRQIGSGQTGDGKSEHRHIRNQCILKWTGMGEFNSDDHYIYYCGQESLRRIGVAIIVNRGFRHAALGYNL